MWQDPPAAEKMSAGWTESCTVTRWRLSPTVRSRVSASQRGDEIRGNLNEKINKQGAQRLVGGSTCGRGLVQDALPVGHLQWSQVRLDAVLPPDPIVDDLDVQLSHPAQDRLGGREGGQ